MIACDQNAIDTVKYMSHLPNFNLAAALSYRNKDGKDGFMLACENHEIDKDIVEYIIVELDFKYNKRQEEYITQNMNLEVVAFAAKLLNTKKFHEQLNTEIELKNIKKHKIKI